MKQVKTTILLLISLLAISCDEEEIVWPLNNQDSDLIVVEAVLTNKKKQHIIKLTRPYAAQNLTPQVVSGATVFIQTNDSPVQTFIATETPIGSGMYLTESIRTVSNKVYTLIINYQSKQYFASAVQPPGEGFSGPLEYHKTTEDSYTLDFNPSGSKANYIKHYLNWQNTAGCVNLLDCQAELIYYDLKNVDINEQFKPTQEVVDFPLGTVVVRKKYSVSEEYQAYLRGVLSETAWRGGIFDVYAANAASNLSIGATGFFAVSTVVTDTTIIK